MMKTSFLFALLVPLLLISCVEESKTKGLSPMQNKVHESGVSHEKVKNPEFQKFITLFPKANGLNTAFTAWNFDVISDSLREQVLIPLDCPFISIDSINNVKSNVDSKIQRIVPIADITGFFNDSTVGLIYLVETDFSFWYILNTYSVSGEKIQSMDFYSQNLDVGEKRYSFANKNKLEITEKKFLFLNQNKKMKVITTHYNLSIGEEGTIFSSKILNRNEEVKNN